MRSGTIRNLFKKYPAIWKVAQIALIVTLALIATIKLNNVYQSIEVLETSNEKLIAMNRDLSYRTEALQGANDSLTLQTDELIDKLEKQEDEFALIADENALLKQTIEKRDAETKRIEAEHKATVSTLQGQVAKLKKEAAAKKTTVSRGASSSAPTTGRTITVSATAYTAYCNGCSGTTATGIDLRSNPSLKVIAVDPRVIPLGSKVWVEGYGHAIAGDTGGAIKGNKIDLFMPSQSNAMKWGRRTVTVRIIK